MIFCRLHNRPYSEKAAPCADLLLPGYGTSVHKFHKESVGPNGCRHSYAGSLRSGYGTSSCMSRRESSESNAQEPSCAGRRLVECQKCYRKSRIQRLGPNDPDRSCVVCKHAGYEKHECRFGTQANGRSDPCAVRTGIHSKTRLYRSRTRTSCTIDESEVLGTEVKYLCKQSNLPSTGVLFHLRFT